MRLKSFYGKTMTDAMKSVRDALGDDAIIVATRDDEKGGVRVTAAIDDQPVTINTLEFTATSPAKKPQAEDEGTDALESIALSLTRHAVPGALAELLMATATQVALDDPLLALSAALDRHLSFQPLTDDATQKPTILIGPPGAGKTLTIAKLATKATLGKRPVTVISTDFERAGGMEQLAAFTRLLKLDLIEIEDPHALADAIAMHPATQIYIDTAGGNPFDANDRDVTTKLVKASGGDATLVMPAGLDAAEAFELADAFRAIGAKRLLLTRLDLSKRLGNLLLIAHKCRLPLANISMSSKVTEPPAPCNPVVLARLLLGIKSEKADVKASDKKAQGGRA